MASSTKTKAEDVRLLRVGHVRSVALIGCGGTGSILAEHLARMIAGYRLGCELTLWDGDRVERANIARQNFARHEIGANKAEALALRLSGQFGLTIAARGRHVDRHETMPTGLVITCTDTLHSRRIVAERSAVALCPREWLDVGNELHHGQAVLGTTHSAEALRCAFHNFGRRPYVDALPDIAALSPKILTARRAPAQASCADQPFRHQGFGVNAMAALAAAMIAKQALVDREVRTSAIYFDVAEGRMLPRPITRDLLLPWRLKPKPKRRRR